ncbi:VWA domain-containing protein [Flavobacteriales bacterium]|nr:VWA domain-containing protein [Flavobacteriales bacterium]
MKQVHLQHILLDASGSMQDCHQRTVSTLNEQVLALHEVQKQHPDQEVKFSISDFSNDYRMWFGPKPIGEIRTIREDQYQLRGSTALYDGLGTLISNTIAHVGEDAPEKGTSISIIVLTDGYENASRFYSAPALKMLMDKLTEKGWEFRFIGADIDPMEVGRSLGMDASRTERYDKDGLEGSSSYMADVARCSISRKRSRYFSAD